MLAMKQSKGFGVMNRSHIHSRMRRLFMLLPALLLGGCADRGFWLFHPHGPVAGAELHYLIADVLVLLVVIVPATALAIWVLLRYRATARARHDPHWTHSTTLEAVIWGVPLAVVGVLAYLSYQGIFAVNPYGPGVLKEADPPRAQSAAPFPPTHPLEVDVITTDWQWLFVYPSLHIASANELVVPTHVPVHFRLTSATVTNDFFIPQLVGQIAVMPGMRTEQSMLVDRAGRYHGVNAEFSGAGFSWMGFKVRALPPARFTRWAARASQSEARLSYQAFDRFARPTVDVTGKITHYSHVQPRLFAHVITQARAGKVYATPYAFSENMHAAEFRKHAD